MRKCGACGAEQKGANNFCTACMVRLAPKPRPSLKEIREKMQEITDRPPTQEQIDGLIDALKLYRPTEACKHRWADSHTTPTGSRCMDCGLDEDGKP